MEYRFSLRAARAYAGLTIHEAARQLGISYSALCSWENGKTEPKASIIKDMAQLYGVRSEDIFLTLKSPIR